MIVVLYSFVGIAILFLGYLVAKLAGALALALVICTIPTFILLAGIGGCILYVRQRIMRRSLTGRRSR